MNKFGEIVLLAVLFPSVASAHGEQVFALPVAQAGVLIILSIAVVVLKMRFIGRMLFIFLPISAMYATWIMPGSVLAPITQKYGYGIGPFLFLGTVPPLIVAAAVFCMFRGHRGKDKLPTQPPVWPDETVVKKMQPQSRQLHEYLPKTTPTQAVIKKKAHAATIAACALIVPSLCAIYYWQVGIKEDEPYLAWASTTMWKLHAGVIAITIALWIFEKPHLTTFMPAEPLDDDDDGH